MKLAELFITKIQDDSKPLNGGAILEGSLNDMVEDHLPENTRVWKIQWVMSEDGNDAYRPQFIFARTKDEAAHKFTERMKHPDLGLVAIESIIEVAFDSLNEGDVVRPFPDKMLWSKRALSRKKSNDEKYDDALAGQQLRRMPDDKLDQAIQKKRQELGFSMSNEEAQNYANDIIDDIKTGLQKGIAIYDDVNDWLFELLAGDLPHDKYDSNLVVKMMLAHPDFDKIHHILKKKYGYDLVSNLTEGEVIPFPKRRSDQEKYDTAAELQRIDKEGNWRKEYDWKNVSDPTKQEMQDVFVQIYEEDDMKYWGQIAMYWFASDFHSGQSSNLYSVLSTSVYNPGPMTNKIEDEDEMAQEMYFTLYDYFSALDSGGYPSESINEGHPWAQRHGKRGERTDEEAFEIWQFLLDNIEEIKELIDSGRSLKQIAIDYDVREEEIDEFYYSDPMMALYSEEEEGDGEHYESKKSKKKRKKKATVKNNFGIKPAEKSTKFDPPQTNYGKNVSARRGFVG